jgi:rod shape-determining protein MreB
MNLRPRLGIDLGTTSTLVFIPSRGVVVNEPTVVAVSDENGEVLAVGNDAKEMVGRTPDTIRAYRPMKDGVIADYQVTEAMLRYFIGRALGKFNLFKPEIVVSAPAGVTSTERLAVIEAALNAGAKDAFVVKEPILAAIGSGIEIQEPYGRMIIDIGGGTTDVAVISLGGIVASTSVKVAGNKLDESIVRYVKKKHGLVIGERTAERAKIKVGAAYNTEDSKTITVNGNDYVTGLPQSIELSTRDIVNAVKDDLKKITSAIAEVLRHTPPELSSDIIEKGIVMSGGSSKLRLLPELVYSQLGVKAELADGAQYCVAKGTGIALEHLDVYKRALTTKTD